MQAIADLQTGEDILFTDMMALHATGKISAHPCTVQLTNQRLLVKRKPLMGALFGLIGHLSDRFHANRTLKNLPWISLKSISLSSHGRNPNVVVFHFPEEDIRIISDKKDDMLSILQSLGHAPA